MFQIKLDKKAKNDFKKHSFWAFKRASDVSISLLLLPLFILISIILLFLNIFYNKGTVYFIQKRMGKDCKAFNAIKFRSMTRIDSVSRKYYEPLEENRITRLGHILRKTKIDELPQILNVILGDMSLIGPRPDFYDHALSFLDQVPSYRYRHKIRPGITGLSQIRLGYAEGLIATKKKSKIDIYYIENLSFLLDLKIFVGTILVIINGFRE
ncbi:sugar transferase [Amylibacter sp.]|nr:sugar transferase [Amylibacter sp.]